MPRMPFHVPWIWAMREVGKISVVLASDDYRDLNVLASVTS